MTSGCKHDFIVVAGPHVASFKYLIQSWVVYSIGSQPTYLKMNLRGHHLINGVGTKQKKSWYINSDNVFRLFKTFAFWFNIQECFTSLVLKTDDYMKPCQMFRGNVSFRTHRHLKHDKEPQLDTTFCSLETTDVIFNNGLYFIR